MGKFIAKRLLYAILVVLGVSIICFVVLDISPGDPTLQLLPDDVPQAQRDALREELGLNKPIVERYFLYLGGVLRGDLGDSYYHKQPNLQLIFQKLPYTLLLSFAAMMLSLIIAIPLGIIAAVKRGSFSDLSATFFGLLGQSLSPVWLGVVLVYILSVRLSLLPSFGAEKAINIIMPSITLGIPLAALITRLTRAGMIDVLSEDYIVATRAKGIGRRLVIFKYALKNVLLPIITVVGLQFSATLGGAVVTEEIFAWPGIGRLFLGAIYNRDFPLVQGIMLVLSILIVLLTLLVDVTYSLVDPRLRFEKK